MQKKKPAHRPSKYKAEYAQIAFGMTLIGATDKDLANAFEVDEKTINTWKSRYPKFLQSIKNGKEKADAQVGQRLFSRAMGYDAPDTHIAVYEGSVIKTPIIKHYPPDVTAQIFWLKNRRPKQFRDKPEVEVTVHNDVTVDTGKPPEEWGAAELEARLRQMGVVPVTSATPANGTAISANGHPRP